MEEITKQLEFIQKRCAARQYALKHGRLIFFNADQKAIALDGGPGSGNHGHSGVPGTRGGSAPSGGASCSQTASRTGKLEKALNSQTADDQAEFISKSGVVPIKEVASLKSGVSSGDKAALQKLEDYKNEYLENVKQAYMPKENIHSEEQEKLMAMSDEEAAQWISNTLSRELTDEEKSFSQNYYIKNGIMLKAVMDTDLAGTPQVVCKEDFDEYVEKSGATVLYTGIHDDEDTQALGFSTANTFYQECFADGEPVVIADEGWTGVELERIALNNTRYYGSEANEENVLKYALRSDAKILDYDESYLISETEKSVVSRLNESDWDQYGVKAEYVTALTLGYDVIREDNAYHVLNRQAIIVQDPMEDATNEIINSASK